jgi:hypothetical protein
MSMDRDEAARTAAKQATFMKSADIPLTTEAEVTFADVVAGTP